MAYNAAAVSNTAIAFQKPITLQQGRALRDNPIAMLEGAPGAPRLQFAALDESFSTAGGIGSYVLASRNTTVAVAFGVAVAGSTLLPAGAVYAIDTSGGNGAKALGLGAALSGSWRCMGYYTHATGAWPVLNGVTLWMRIA